MSEVKVIAKNFRTKTNETLIFKLPCQYYLWLETAAKGIYSPMRVYGIQ